MGPAQHRLLLHVARLHFYWLPGGWTAWRNAANGFYGAYRATLRMKPVIPTAEGFMRSGWILP